MCCVCVVCVPCVCVDESLAIESGVLYVCVVCVLCVCCVYVSTSHLPYRVNDSLSNDFFFKKKID